MGEEQMIEVVEAALRELGSSETVFAAGQFMPRGHTGSMFAGGLLGDSLGGSDLAGSIATAGGALAGARLHDAAAGLPGMLLVGVTGSHVYAFDTRSRSRSGPLVFRVARDSLEVKVHQRVNVRILELIDTNTGSRIELEGNRVPLTHSKDVIHVLQS